MWLLTEDGALVNLDRTSTLEIRLWEGEAHLLAACEIGRAHV